MWNKPGNCISETRYSPRNLCFAGFQSPKDPSRNLRRPDRCTECQARSIVPQPLHPQRTSDKKNWPFAQRARKLPPGTTAANSLPLTFTLPAQTHSPGTSAHANKHRMIEIRIPSRPFSLSLSVWSGTRSIFARQTSVSQDAEKVGFAVIPSAPIDLLCHNPQEKTDSSANTASDGQI